MMGHWKFPRDWQSLLKKRSFLSLPQVFLAFFLVACLTFTFFLQGCSGNGGIFRNFFSSQQSASLSNQQNEALSLYHQAWQLVFTDYVDSTFNGQNWYRWKDRYDKQIKTRADAYEAIDTMLASLNDVYTRFLDPQAANDQNMNIDSQLSGVGLEITTKGNQLIVMAPLDGSPAKKAGLMPLDHIIKINGLSTANMSIHQAVNKIRGPKGTTVELTVLRGQKILNFKVVRAEIEIKTVFGKPISKDIGYIRLASFISQNTAHEMRTKVLSEENTKAMIIDLRGNSGGLLPNALEISDMFLKGGKIVSIADRDGVRRTYYAKRSQLYSKPLVLLVDGGSASASEIFSGALKDNHRATLIGTKTFGKGLVQKINYLQDGSELNLTIAKYYTPLGYDINKKGIQPNMVVPFTEADFRNHRDPEKDAAIKFLQKQLLAKAS